MTGFKAALTGIATVAIATDTGIDIQNPIIDIKPKKTIGIYDSMLVVVTIIICTFNHKV